MWATLASTVVRTGGAELIGNLQVFKTH
jgi:hypothetical protein